MQEKTGFFRSMFRGLADMQELAAIPILLAMGLVALVSTPFVENVAHGEIVVCESRFGGGTAVWRGWIVDGWHWQGLGEVTEYHERTRRDFRKEIEVDGTRYVVRGTAHFGLLGDDAEILALHRTYGSEDAIAERLVLPAVYAAIDQAAADPAWARLEGGLVERKLKSGVEYALKRVSPTGGIWTAPETRKRLQADLNVRLSHGTGDPGIFDKPARGIPITIELGFVTER